MDALETIDLGCTRGDRPLFTGLNFRVSAGQLLHVVGNNGSGKTTLLRTLCGLSHPADGEIRWRGQPIQVLGDEYHQALAYLGHLDGVQGELTPPENVASLASLAGAADDGAVAQALDRMGLSAYRAFPAKILSQGQRRRLALARLLVNPKPLWILDEPFTALDVRSCRLMTELLSEHLQHGGIAVLSSHQEFDLPGGALVRVDLDKLRDNRGALKAAAA
jgi:heme exporter protein A